ncbi:MAG: 2-C-methyl-D-erythritol 4-phosphate cytidylyltransferase [Chitinophagaceae bacterium]|nr:2-C-methyl-D-erythritol 4-phosphate cytidylyltransferase [Chitinophagaceae bacterium]
MLYAIIVAGGSGTRMKSDRPKQFLMLGDKPIYYYSVECFLNTFPDLQLILVLPPAYLNESEAILSIFPSRDRIQIVAGGESRFQSVKNGLEAISGEAGMVFIHDAVRPFITSNFLQHCLNEAQQYGNAIPCLPLKDSIRMLEASGNRTVDRSAFRTIQTPQTFQLNEIQEAFQLPYQEAFTDEATVLESIGKTIHLMEGLVENIKITTPEDLNYAHFLLS